MTSFRRRSNAAEKEPTRKYRKKCASLAMLYSHVTVCIGMWKSETSGGGKCTNLIHQGMWTKWTAMGPIHWQNKSQLGKCQSLQLLSAVMLLSTMVPARLRHMCHASYILFLQGLGLDVSPIMCLLRYRFFCMYQPSPAGEFATNAEVHPTRLFQMDEASHHNFSFKGAFAFGCQAI